MNLNHLTVPPKEKLTLASGFKDYNILCCIEYREGSQKVYWFLFYKHFQSRKFNMGFNYIFS